MIVCSGDRKEVMAAIRRHRLFVEDCNHPGPASAARSEPYATLRKTAYAFFYPDRGGGRPAWIVQYYDESTPLPDGYCVLSVDMYADTGKIYVYYPWEY